VAPRHSARTTHLRMTLSRDVSRLKHSSGYFQTVYVTVLLHVVLMKIILECQPSEWHFAKCHSAEHCFSSWSVSCLSFFFHYTDCHLANVILLNAVITNIILQIEILVKVVLTSVIMLNVVAPKIIFKEFSFESLFAISFNVQF